MFFKKNKIEEKIIDALVEKSVNKILASKERELSRKDFEARKELLKLNEAKKCGFKGIKDIQQKREDLIEKMHEHQRKANSMDDDNAIQAKAIEHTLDFIKWLLKK